MVQIVITILLSSVKFAMTFPLAILQFQFSFMETILWTNLGGIIGIYFFAFLSHKVISWWNRIFRKPGRQKHNDSSREKKVFTKRKRRIIRIKQQYGLIGIAVSTPVLLSIPVGAFLIVRYYRASKTAFFYMIASILAWSVIYTVIFLFWDGLLLKKA